MSETEKVKKAYLPRYRGHSRLMRTGNSGSLSVPSDLMGVLTNGLLFKPELTKDGILFRIVDENKIIADEKTIPAWVKKVGTGSKTSTSEDAVSEPDDEEQETDDNVESDEEPPTDEDDSPF